LFHVRQLLGIAYGVQPGDEAAVDAYREDGVDRHPARGRQHNVSIAALLAIRALMAGVVQRGRRSFLLAAMRQRRITGNLIACRCGAC